MKHLYYGGVLAGYELSNRMKLPFQAVVQPILKFLKDEKLCEIKKGAGISEGVYTYALTDEGRRLLGVFIVGYAISFVHAWWRLARLRRRAVYVDSPEPQPAPTNVIEPEFSVVEVVVDGAGHGPSDPA